MKNIIFCIVLILLTLKAYSQNKTPNYWKCDNRTGGSWNFGRAPSVCDVDPFISRSYVESVYSPLIFLDSQDQDVERSRYMQEVYGVIKDTARYFIESRKPEVSLEEVEEFSKAILAVAHQESYWSHYRIPTSNKYQFMRGDYGHGHGIFQVDDRWHFVAINEARGANFILNMFYSLDEYYDAWKRAPSMSCVSSETDWRSIARSAYSAYNGGASRICRWTNSKDKWARNDVGFLTKYDQRSWEHYIDDLSYEGYLNVECAFNEDENCDKGDTQDVIRKNVSYAHTDYGNCFYSDSTQKFYCSNQNEICLASKVYGEISTKFKRSKFKDIWDTHEVVEYGEENLCSELKGLYPVLSTIKVLKNINIRKTPGGEKIDVFQSGLSSVVLDFSISSTDKLDRYYKIQYKNSYGYIFAGNIDDFEQWAEITSDNATYSSIARAGEYVSTQEEMRSVDKEHTIFENEKHQVEASYAKGTSLFYRLSVADEIADFYAGNLLDNNFYDFFKSYKEKEREDEPEVRVAKLNSRIWWKKIQSCPSTKCSSVATVKGPRMSSKTFEVLKEENGWFLIRQYGNEGWIKTKYVKVL